MRARLLIAVVGLLTVSCLDIDNSWARFGGVRGRVASADQAVALAVVLHEAGLRSTVDADGNFVIHNVPIGDRQVLVIANANAAVQVGATIRPARITDLGELFPGAATFIDVTLHTPAGQSLALAEVEIDGTHYEHLGVDASGFVRAGPLAEGCYEVEATLPGFDQPEETVCVTAGQQAAVDLYFSQVDGGEQSGCELTGCEEGLRCASDGDCVECLEGDACGPGLACVNERCEGALPVCVGCDGDWQCGGSGHCEPMDGSTEATCLVECGTGLPCTDPGHACQSGRCIPDPANMTGCEGYRLVGASCTSPEPCQQGGLVNGTCAGDICTFSCTGDAQCPAGYACTDLGGTLTCQPAP